MRRLAAILLLPLLAHAAATEIRDTAYTAFNGVLFSGKLTITGPDMTTADGRTVHRWEQAYTIASGAISLDLEPNDTAAPAGTSYLVRFNPANGVAWTERWIVPTSASPLKVHQVRVQTVPSPSLTVQPSQILGGGASDGQSLLWSQSNHRWQPGAVEAGVGSVFGRTGAVTAQSGDYAVADVTGLQTALDGRAATSHGHAEADVTNLVVDLASKPSGSGTQNALPFWLTTGSLGSMDATWDSLNKILQINGRNGAYLRFGESVPAGPPYMVLDIKPEQMDAYEDFRVRFLNPNGTSSGSWIGGSMSGGPWTLFGFSITPSSLNMNSYMSAPGYRTGMDFNPTVISSASYNFGALFNGGGNGYRKFKLTTSVTAPGFDFSITQPGYTTVLEICQDATGGRTITFPSNVLFGPLDTTPNKCTVQMLITRSMSVSPWAGAFPLAPAASF
jgi:hypothetical protein